MKQPEKKQISSVKLKTKKKKSKRTICTNVSNLEKRFENNVLIELGLNYKTQFLIEKIGRFYDFYIEEYNLCLEVDGDFFHINPKFYKDKILTIIQKRNKRVDKLKNEYCYKSKINLIRIWEYDINNNLEKVKKELLSVIEEIKNKNNKGKPIQRTLLFD